MYIDIMNSNSNPASTRRKTETETFTEVVEKGSGAGDDIVVSALGGSGSDQVTTSENVVVDTDANILTDDILPEILKNLDIRNSKDLLNLRLVNRCCRDVATSFLLKFNMCQIVLNFGKVITDVDGNTVCVEASQWAKENYYKGHSPEMYKYFNAKQPRSFLSDLNQLISTSPKFPSTSFRFESDCGWRSFYPPSDWRNNAFPHQTDSLHFFSVYGTEIRKLTLTSGISSKALQNVQNLIYGNMPHLICIDFEDVFDIEEIPGRDLQEDTVRQVCLPPPSTLEIKEIVVGTDEIFTENKSNLLRELISVSPNLTAVHNVGEVALGKLLDFEKSHLIQDLNLGPRFRQMETIARFTIFLADTILKNKHPNLQLSKFNVHLSNIPLVWKAINLILSASKNSLKCIQLNMHP